MRIIHTADWHLGHTLVGHGRDHELRTVLAELVGIAVEREADALIVAGDVFDNQSPSGESLRLFYDTLLALRRARPAMTIVVTAGNHDAAGRLEAPHPLLDAMNVHIVGNIRRRDGVIDAARHLVALPAPGGDIAGHVLAVSYPTAACLRPPRAGEEAGADQVTRDLYEELMAATGAGRAGLPLVVTGHLTVAGGLESEGAERRILIGGQHAVTPAVFPEAAAYVALGHLHKAQTLAQTSGQTSGQTLHHALDHGRVRYSGSLLPLSASEIGYRHGVTLVTLAGDGRPPAQIEHIALERPVAFHRLPAEGACRIDEIADRLEALDLDPGLAPEHWPFVQVCLARDGLPAGYRAEMERAAEDFPVRLLEPRVARVETGAAHAIATQPLVRLAELDPATLFSTAFERTHGTPPGPAHLAAFHAAAASLAREV